MNLPDKGPLRDFHLREKARREAFYEHLDLDNSIYAVSRPILKRALEVLESAEKGEASASDEHVRYALTRSNQLSSVAGERALQSAWRSTQFEDAFTAEALLTLPDLTEDDLLGLLCASDTSWPVWVQNGRSGEPMPRGVLEGILEHPSTTPLVVAMAGYAVWGWPDARLLPRVGTGKWFREHPVHSNAARATLGVLEVFMHLECLYVHEQMSGVFADVVATLVEAGPGVLEAFVTLAKDRDGRDAGRAMIEELLVLAVAL